MDEQMRREMRQVMARAAEMVERAERLVTELSVDAAHRADARRALLEHEARHVRTEQRLDRLEQER